MAHQPYGNQGAFRPKALLSEMTVLDANNNEGNSFEYVVAPAFHPDGPIECKEIIIYNFRFVLVKRWLSNGETEDRYFNMNSVHSFDVIEWYKEVIELD